MTSTLTASRTSTDERLRRYGLIGAVASVVGALLAVVLIAWQPTVSEERFSYPFDAGWFTVAQVTFAVQHVAMLPLFAALLLLERRHPSRLLRAGTWVALVGQVLLTVVELIAITAARSQLTDTAAEVAGSLYGVPMVLLGLGAVLAGVGALRVGLFGDLFGGSARWLLLALGIYVFVALFPAVFGPMVAGRIAIGVWLLGFAALGLAIRESAAAHQSVPSAAENTLPQVLA